MDEKNNKDSATSRRKFIALLVGFMASVNALALGIPFIRTLVSASGGHREEAWTRVGELGSFHAGEPMEARFATLTVEAYQHKSVLNSAWVLKKSDTEVTVFSPICTHLGCHYAWNGDTGHFECPCHASVFAPDGRVLSGPAPRPLDALPAKIENGVLFVRWERFRTGSPQKIIV